MDNYKLKNEFEFVNYDKYQNIRLFVNRLIYRAPHLHRDFEIDLILEGNCSFIVKGETIALTTGDIILLNENTIHEIQGQTKSVKLLSLQISKDFFKQFDFTNAVFENILPRSILTNSAFQDLTQTLVKLVQSYFLNQTDSSKFFIFGLVCEIYGSLLKYVPHICVSKDNPDRGDLTAKRITKILAYLDENFNKKITLQDVSKDIYIAPQYLSHYFTKNIGMPFRDYIAKLRFNHAVQLIDYTEMPLIEICYESGFSDYKYMEKMFIKNFGCSPQNYRRKNMPNEKRNFKRSNEYIYSDQDALRIVQSFIVQQKHL